MPPAREVVARVSVAQAPILRIEDTIEAGDERARGYVCNQRFVDPSQYLTRGFPRLNDGPEHAAGRSHHKGSRHTMAGGVPHYQPQAPVFQFEEVVEVSSHFPSRSVVGCYPPAIEFGCRLGQELLLDPAGDAKF